MTDACTFASKDTWTLTCMEKHTQTHTQAEERESKGSCVMREKPLRGGEQRLYLCSLPFHTSDLHTLQITASSSSCTHTHYHAPCAPLREKHLLLLQRAEITVMGKERVGKQGMERKNTSEDLSLLLLSTEQLHRAVRAQELHSCTATHKHTHTNAAQEIIGRPRL